MRTRSFCVALGLLCLGAPAQGQCRPGTVPVSNPAGHVVCLPPAAATAVAGNPNLATATPTTDAATATATFTSTAPASTATATATEPPADTPTVTPTPCASGGTAVGGFCWYLGAENASCDATCSGIGATCAAATITFAGSDGTSENCQNVLAALGVVEPFTESSECLDGFGCAVIPGFVAARCTAPPTTCAAGGATVARACACQ